MAIGSKNDPDFDLDKKRCSCGGSGWVPGVDDEGDIECPWHGKSSKTVGFVSLGGPNGIDITFYED